MSLRWPLAQHIYLSPHLDDVVLSCGGLVFEQARRGDTVAVITLFAASPSPYETLSHYAQSLHQRWQASAPPGVDFSDPPALRRAEDRRALAALHPSIQVVHADMLDCIYRTDTATGKALYASEAAIFGTLQPNDPAYVDLQSASALPEGATLYSPLGIGHHVDHQVVRCAVEAWGLPPQNVCYYEDYPYAAAPGALEAALGIRSGWKTITFPITNEALSAKTRAIAEYASQISTFWENEEAMNAAVREQARLTGGERFWQLSS